MVKGLLATGVDSNYFDVNGRTALWYAASRGHVECATALLDAKADVNKADNNGYTPLHLASINGHLTCVQVCLPPF
jgi:ankyrin repeat protein